MKKLIVTTILLLFLIIPIFSEATYNIPESKIKEMNDFNIEVEMFKDGINVTDKNTDLINFLKTSIKTSINYNPNSNNVISWKYYINTSTLKQYVKTSIFKKVNEKKYVAYKKDYSLNEIDRNKTFNMGEQSTKDIMDVLKKYNKVFDNLKNEIKDIVYNLNINFFIDDEKDIETSKELTNIIIDNLKKNYNCTYDINSKNKINIDMKFNLDSNKCEYNLQVYKSNKLIYKYNYESGMTEQEIDEKIGGIVLTGLIYLSK